MKKAKKAPSRPSAGVRARPPDRRAKPEPGEPSGNRFCVVGVGASAGGLEPTTALLAGLPLNCGLAIVIVQHLDPSYPSQATELLARRTALKVETARDGIRVQVDHVYTIPSDRDAYLEGERLRVVEQPPKHQIHLPIDRFFRSLGGQLKERAIGIVLSGTGSDGSLGLETIVANGGIALVQEPASAQYEGMPRSALATGAASSVLAVSDMPAVLCRYARHPYTTRPASAGVVSAADAASLEQILLALRTGHALDFSSYKRAMVMRRIERRMGLRQIAAIEQYARLIDHDTAELDALRRDLLIGVTSFFRDPQAWQVLEQQVLEPLMRARRPVDPVRVWVAGAATGEEAYSLAMLLLEVRNRLGTQCALQVFATDASEDAIAFARRGRYPAGIAEQVSPERLQRFFERVDADQHFQIRPELRSCVIFGLQKLIDDPPFSRLDLISCRNVLMYLEQAAQQQVLATLKLALHPGGFLFLGTAESVESSEADLRPISRRWRLYRRAGELPAAANRPAVLPAGPRSTATPPGWELAPKPARDFAATAERILLERYCAASFLINVAGETMYLYGRTEPYLAHRSGAPSHDLLSMLRPDLRAPLRRILRKIARQELDTAVEEVRVRRGHVLTSVRMSVVPASAGKRPSPAWLVILQDVPTAPVPAKRVRGTLVGVVKQLEEELRTTQHDLRNTVEQMEASTQDLKASNEELVTVNEELQVANEELQSSKEELQSLNEELQTVNQQLHSKVAELETSGNDLNNLLESSQILTVCFDRGLRVRWYSPTARAAFNLAANDIGRAMATFTDAPIGPSALEDARRILAGQPTATGELHWSQRWFVRRLLPYRVANHAVEGVIVTLTDITETKHAAEARLAERASEALALEKGIEERTEQLRELSVALTVTEERERRAIAADLHDDLGQTLALVQIKLDLLRPQVPGGVISDGLSEASALLLQTSNRMRSLAFQLSPTILYELGLVPALEWLADEMHRLYSLKVKVAADQDSRRPLDANVRAALFRAVRELLINVGKHARTDTAAVDCRRSKDQVRIVVSDSGKGFDPAAAMQVGTLRGFGLRSVRERMRGLGGGMECESIQGDGSRVTLSLPVTVQSRPGMTEKT